MEIPRKGIMIGAVLSGVLALSGCAKSTMEIKVPPQAEDVTPKDAKSYVKSFYFEPGERRFADSMDCSYVGREEQDNPDGSTVITCRSNFLYKLVVVDTSP